MYRLLIADDEFIELSALTQFLRAQLADSVMIETANNGMELLSVFERFNPDLILTDVEMPGLNGLVALRIIRRLSRRCKIIIHSAYNHFEYVRDALDLRSDAYILKPAKRQDILGVIQETLGKLRAEDERERWEERSQQILEDLIPLLENDCVTSILLSDIDETKLLKYLDLLEIKFGSGCMITFQFLTLNTGGLASIGEGKKERLEWLLGELKGIGSILVGPYINDKITCLVTFSEGPEEHHQVTWLVQLARNLVDKAKERFGNPCFAGIGRIQSSLADLNRSYRESNLALADRESGQIVRYAGDSLPVRPPADPFGPRQVLLLSALEARNEALLLTRLEETLEELSRASLSFDQQKDAVLLFVITIRKSTADMTGGGQLQSSTLRLDIGAIHELQEFRALREWLVNLVRDLLKELTSVAVNTKNSHTNEAIKFIDNNYMKSISLDLVAESIGVSSYYLSHLFTLEKGKTYISYLTEFRVRKARQIMESRSATIEEIANSVGYSNAAYFIKIFKKITGHGLREVNRRCTESES
jgi:two-component system response regulator YesN